MGQARCPICGGLSEIALLSRFRELQDEPLLRCSECSFCYFDARNWLGEAFSEDLNDLDLGSVARCLLVADFVTAVFSPRRGRLRVLDWGGGDGLLTRVLRDRGIDCVWHDPFAKPRFVGDSVHNHRSPIDLTVVSEVFLHLTDPVSSLRELLELSEVVIVTAVVPPEKIDTQWWYLMSDTGQHVSFYTLKSLLAMAKQTNSYLCTDGGFFHVFSRRKLPTAKRLLVGNRPLAFGRSYLQHGVRMIRTAFGKSVSITPSDQERLIATRRKALGS